MRRYKIRRGTRYGEVGEREVRGGGERERRIERYKGRGRKTEREREREGGERRRGR